MRVIAGKWRSRPLMAPAGMDTRPTADRLRETLFNVLTQGARDRVAEARFLDLYAGSGAVGIEALSRGAAEVVFVEQAAGALAALRKNLAGLGVGDGASVVKRGVGRYLKEAAGQAGAGKDLTGKDGAGRFGVVFLDPPYESAAEYEASLGLLGGEGLALLADGAVVAAEHRRKRPLEERYGELVRVRVIEQGDAGLSLYEMAAQKDGV